jgi:hypothetical protein
MLMHTYTCFYILVYAHVYAIDLSNVPMLVLEVGWKPEEEELSIKQLKAA